MAYSKCFALKRGVVQLLNVGIKCVHVNVYDNLTQITFGLQFLELLRSEFTSQRATGSLTSRSTSRSTLAVTRSSGSTLAREIMPLTDVGCS